MRLDSEVIECPTCGKLYTRTVVLSGDTYGATFWTDGKTEAPMLPSVPEMTKCDQCSTMFWVEEAHRPQEENRKRISHHDRIRHLTTTECLDAIRNGKARTDDEETYLRILAWRGRNDAFRRTSVRQVTATLDGDTPEMQLNMIKLLSLLNMQDSKHRLMKAEILRETGSFDDALKLLDESYPEQFSPYVECIRKYSLRRDTKLREVDLE